MEIASMPRLGSAAPMNIDATMANILLIWLIVLHVKIVNYIKPLHATIAALEDDLAMAHGHQAVLEQDIDARDNVIENLVRDDAPPLPVGPSDALLADVGSMLGPFGRTAKGIAEKLVAKYPELTKRDVNKCLYTLKGQRLATVSQISPGSPKWRAA